MSNTAINPNEVRITQLSGTIPPVAEAKGGRDALWETHLRGGKVDINLEEELNRTRSFVEKLSSIFGKKAPESAKTHAEQIQSERAAAQAEKATTEHKPQESGVSYENNLKPSFVAQVQNAQKETGQERSR